MLSRKILVCALLIGGGLAACSPRTPTPVPAPSPDPAPLPPVGGVVPADPTPELPSPEDMSGDAPTTVNPLPDGAAPAPTPPPTLPAQ